MQIWLYVERKHSLVDAYENSTMELELEMETFKEIKAFTQAATIVLLAIVVSTTAHAQVIDLDKVVAGGVNVGDQLNFGKGGNPLVIPKGSWKLLAQSDFEHQYTSATIAAKAVSFKNADAAAPLQVIMVSTNPSTFYRGGRPFQSACKPIPGSNVQNFGLTESTRNYICSEFYQQLAFPEFLGKVEVTMDQFLSFGAKRSLVEPLLADHELLSNIGENPIIINVRVQRAYERRTYYTFISKSPAGRLEAADAESNRKSLDGWVRAFAKSAMAMAAEDKALQVQDFPTLAPMGQVASEPVKSLPPGFKFESDVVQRGWEDFQKAATHDRIFLLSKDQRSYQWRAKSWPYTNLIASELFLPINFGSALMVNETYIPAADTAK